MGNPFGSPDESVSLHAAQKVQCARSAHVQLFLKLPLGARASQAVQNECPAQWGTGIASAYLLLRHGRRSP